MNNDEIKNENDEFDEELNEYDTANIKLTDKSVRYNYTQYSISSLIDWIETGIICIPSYQRRFVWKKSQSAILVDSVLRGLPIPPIVLVENPSTNQLELLDGLQRILSLYYFYKNSFPKNPEIYRIDELKTELNKKNQEDHDEGINRFNFEEFKLTSALLKYEKEDNENKLLWLDVYYEDLKKIKADNIRTLQQKFDSYIVGVLQITVLSPSYETSIELFSRLNKGGTQLEANEIRMRTASEKTHQLMIEVTHLDNWMNLIANYVPRRKDTSRELILRVLAMLNVYEKKESLKPTTRMLDDLMKKEQESDKENSYVATLLEQNKIYINSALDLLVNCSKKSPFVYQNSSRINSSLAEVLLSILCYAIKNDVALSKDKVCELAKYLSSPKIYSVVDSKEYEFRNIMGKDSSKTSSIEIRHNLASQFLLQKNIISD